MDSTPAPTIGQTSDTALREEAEKLFLEAADRSDCARPFSDPLDGMLVCRATRHDFPEQHASV